MNEVFMELIPGTNVPKNAVVDEVSRFDIAVHQTEPLEQSQATSQEGNWKLRANCREVDTSVFYPHDSDRLGIKIAKSICDDCVVRSECLEFALDIRDDDGIYGGLKADERRKILNSRRRIGKLATG